QFHQGWEPRLDVIIDGILPMEPIMQVLKILGEEEVPTLIQIKVEFLGGVQYRFERDDAHIMLTKDFEAGPEFLAHAMPAVPCMLVAASGHALVAEEPELLELSDLHRYVEITVQDSSESRVKDTRMFSGSRVYYLSDFFTKRQALLMGMGYGWMPMYLVSEDIEQDRLREVPYSGGSRYEFTPALVHGAHRPLGPTGQRFLALLREIFAV
ncbi:MAG: LysR substrate-binding domain-containing protein, partial [Bradymonadaceae bacterium]